MVSIHRPLGYGSSTLPLHPNLFYFIFEVMCQNKNTIKVKDGKFLFSWCGHVMYGHVMCGHMMCGHMMCGHMMCGHVNIGHMAMCTTITCMTRAFFSCWASIFSCSKMALSSSLVLNWALSAASCAAVLVTILAFCSSVSSLGESRHHW